MASLAPAPLTRRGALRWTRAQTRFTWWRTTRGTGCAALRAGCARPPLRAPRRTRHQWAAPRAGTALWAAQPPRRARQVHTAPCRPPTLRRAPRARTGMRLGCPPRCAAAPALGATTAPWGARPPRPWAAPLAPTAHRARARRWRAPAPTPAPRPFLTPRRRALRRGRRRRRRRQVPRFPPRPR